MNITKKIKESIKKFLINRQISRVVNVYNRKLEKFDKALIKNIQLTETDKKKYETKWAMPPLSKVNSKYLSLCLGYTNLYSTDYIPESIYYTIIEPILNKMSINKAYSDKNFYDHFYDENLFPETIYRSVEGVLMDRKYEKIDTLNLVDLSNSIVVVKPSLDTGGGKGVEIFKRLEEEEEEEEDFVNSKGLKLNLNFLSKYNGNYIIQSKIVQHPFFQQFNNSSVNTLRVFTYRSVVTNKISVLHIVLRIGAQGCNVDNSRAGGFSIGIDVKGRLNNFAINKDGHKFHTVNNINLEKNVFEVPYFKEVKRTAEKIAQKNIYDRVLGLDMIVNSKNDIKCLEINNSGIEINFHQLNSGPLFLNFTDEVLSYSKKNLSDLYKRYVLE